MNCNRLFSGILSGIGILSGLSSVSCSDKIYDSSYEDFGTVSVAVEAPEGVSECTLLVPDVDTVEVVNGSVSEMKMPTGNVRLIAFGNSAGISSDGSVVTAEDISALPQFWSCESDIRVKPSETVSSRLVLLPKTREISLEVTAGAGIDGIWIENVAASVDLEFNRLFAPATLPFDIENIGDVPSVRIFGFACDEIILGISRTAQEPSVNTSSSKSSSVNTSSAKSTSSKSTSEREILRFSAPLKSIGNNATYPVGISVDLSGDAPEVYLAAEDGGEPVAMEKVMEDVPEEPVVYSVGDYWPDPSADVSDPEQVAEIQGVVFSVSEDGLHGKIVSLAEGSGLKWNTTGEADNTDDAADGKVNFDIIKAKDPEFAAYPAFAWCASLGGGWYIPAMEEVAELRSAWGASQEQKDAFNARLEAAGGVPLSATKYVAARDKEMAAYYYSSTEYAQGRNKIWSYSFNGSGDPVSGIKKSSDSQENLLFRAVRTF